MECFCCCPCQALSVQPPHLLCTTATGRRLFFPHRFALIDVQGMNEDKPCLVLQHTLKPSRLSVGEKLKTNSSGPRSATTTWISSGRIGAQDTMSEAVGASGLACIGLLTGLQQASLRYSRWVMAVGSKRQAADVHACYGASCGSFCDRQGAPHAPTHSAQLSVPFTAAKMQMSETHTWWQIIHPAIAACTVNWIRLTSSGSFCFDPAWDISWWPEPIKRNLCSKRIMSASQALSCL